MVATYGHTVDHRAPVEVVDTDPFTAVLLPSARTVTVQFNGRGLTLWLDFEEVKALVQVLKEVVERMEVLTVCGPRNG